MKPRSVIVGLTLAFAMVATSLSAQERRPLDHPDYDVWNRIDGERLAPDGDWVVYALVPGDGDKTLVLRETRASGEWRRPRGTEARFTANSRWVVFTVEPSAAAVDAAKAEGSKGDALPKDSLAMVELGALTPGAEPGGYVAGRVKSFSVPEDDGEWVAYLLESPAEDDDARDSGEEEPEVEDEAHDKDEGAELILRHLASSLEFRFRGVTAYRFSRDGANLYYTVSSEDGAGDGAYRVEVESGVVTSLATGEGKYTQLVVDESGRRAAFLTNKDDWEDEQPSFTLYVDDAPLASEGDPGIPEGWWVNQKGDVTFSDDGSRVFFGTAPRPAPEPEDEIDEEDEVTLDVWNWQDPYIMPMQLIQAESERDRAYTAVVPSDGGPVIQLGTLDLPNVTVGSDGDAPVALGTTGLPYRQLVSWDGRYADYYTIDVNDGTRKLVAERVRSGRPSLSPASRFIYWWDGTERAWLAWSIETGEASNLTAQIPFPVHDLFDDRPEPPGSIGTPRWTEGDAGILINDWHDIWLIDPTGRQSPRNVTEGVGRREGLRFTYVQTDPEEDVVPMGRDVLLSAFHLTEKSDGFYRDRFDRSSEPRLLVMDDVEFSTPTKAKDSDIVLLTRQTFREFPDLWVADDRLDGLTKISNANPQQEEYAWGTEELVSWISNDGIPLQGILYKPDDFDPSRKYPMMVYFYERNSDGLHRYTVPAAGSSSINRSFYVSRGYLFFVPDIPYELGHPGESAADAVIPGVLSILDSGFVDRDRIGVQGHSWGGYQISWIITRSNLFAAAEAGAPVVNMTSAYGGIRWGTGMVRQFQYEQTQSRIGGTLWDRPLEYLDNSPLFQADKIQTPLLMMHNDQDTAVPWYQGIEMFVAMRRLGKPTWLLNYNGEPHGLRREANRRDFAIRMQQFFDHYLMDAPPPVWMVEGVPAVLKGKTLGLDLVTKPVTQQGGSGGGRP